MIDIKLDIRKHEDKDRIFAEFPFDKKLYGIIKGIKGARWSPSQKAWHFPVNNMLLEQFITASSPYAKLEMRLLTEQLSLRQQLGKSKSVEQLPLEIGSALEEMKNWMKQNRYSDRTIENYMDYLRRFFGHYRDVRLEQLQVEHVYKFNSEMIIQKRLSASYQKGLICALKLFFSRLAASSMNIEKLEHPIKEKRLPEILSQQEIIKILESTQNKKHRAMLSLIYACGLRRSEVLNLTIKDLDGQRGLIRVEMGKGKKDRYIPFTDALKKLLREYYQLYRPKKYLFEGQSGGKYGERSIELVLANAVKKADIRKSVTLHTLRHSYATHLLEKGTNIRYIQELLGHSSPKTTMIYTHVSRTKLTDIGSPFDDLEL